MTMHGTKRLFAMVGAGAAILAITLAPAAAQGDGDGDLRRLERDLAHGGTRKGQKAVECSSDAHGQMTSGLGLGHLQPYGLARARRASGACRLVRAVLPAPSGAKHPRSTHIQLWSP